MDYAKSYMSATSLADRIRQSAAQGDTAKAGLASRKTARQEYEDDLETIRAKYLNDIRTMFSNMLPSQEQAKKDIREFLGEEEPLRPKANPKHFAANLEKGNLSERELLALTLQAEAGGEGVGGMLAAGAVIANRVNTKGYGDTFSDVILAPGQFSAWNSLTGYAGGEGGLDMSSLRASEEAYKVADQILSGEYESPVGGATHYYNPNVADPAWGKRGGGNWQTIGNHVFGYGN